MNTALIFDSPEPLCEMIRSLGTPRQHDSHVATFEAERRRIRNRQAVDSVIAAVKNGTLDQLLFA